MKIVDVLYEKCACCGKDIKDNKDFGVKMHERYFCKDCVMAAKTNNMNATKKTK